MVKRSQLIELLPQPEYKKVKIETNQSANDIIKEIKLADEIYRPQYKLIAHLFKSESVTKTAKKVWDFLKTQMRYKIEGDSWQTSKSPSVLLSQGYGDCKHFTLFTVGILNALGYECVFRFTSYKISDETPQHVYTLVKLENGSFLPVDGVLNEFAKEKSFYHKKDVTPMALYRISGFPVNNKRVLKQGISKSKPKGFLRVLANTANKKQKIAVPRVFNSRVRRALPVVSGYDENGVPIGNIFKKVGKGIKKAVKATGKGIKNATKFTGKTVAKAAKATGKGVANAAKFTGKTIVKIAATPARNAFLALVGLNFKQLGYKLNKAIIKDPAKVQKFWVKTFKGSWSSLNKAVARGASKGKKYTPGIGEPATASFLAVAGPILIAAFTLLSSILGKKEASEGGDISQGIDQEMLADENLQAQLKNADQILQNAKYAANATPINLGEGETFGDGGVNERMYSNEQNSSQTISDEPLPNEPQKDNTLLYLGGIGAAILILRNQ